MFIPYKDENPRILIPYVTWSILIINVVVFFLEIAGGIQSVSLRFGTIPAVLTGFAELPASIGTSIPPALTLITSMFLHGSLMHLLGNMLFLYVFADNVESILGHRKFLLFYISCGILATLSQVATNTDSAIPIIGASGAISGVMAGYMLKYPTARIHVLVFIFPVMIPAALVVGFWFLVQIINGAADWNGAGSGVAWFAHIGGFLAGSILMYIISRGKFYWIK